MLDVVAYFERSVARHEEDEERSLFPRLAPLGHGPLMAQLERAHRDHERMQREIADLARSLERGEVTASSAAQALKPLARPPFRCSPTTSQCTRTAPPASADKLSF